MDRILIPIIALVAAWILGAVFTKMLIPFLEKKQFRQFVREEGPKSHLSKTGTPSMGGIAIVFATILSAVMVSVTVAGKSSDYKSLIAVLVVMVLFGLIGFIDDYEKAIMTASAQSRRLCFSLYFRLRLRCSLISTRVLRQSEEASCGFRLRMYTWISAYSISRLSSL